MLATLLTSLIFWPNNPYTKPSWLIGTYITLFLLTFVVHRKLSTTEDTAPLLSASEVANPPGLEYTLQGKSFREQVLSLEFIYFVIYFSLVYLLAGFFIGSVGDQLCEIGGPWKTYL
jgi:hypothetical protein